MEASLLPTIAIYSRDIFITKTLLCTCKIFQDINVWLLKFIHEFPHRKFFMSWTSYENYFAQKLDNFALLIMIEDKTLRIDNFLYQYVDIFEILLQTIYAENDDVYDYMRPYFFKLKLINRFVLIIIPNDNNIKVYKYFASFRDVLDNINNNGALKNENYIIVDFEKMTPVFETTKKTNNKHKSRTNLWFWTKENLLMPRD
jgi:hypothetical protein